MAIPESQLATWSGQGAVTTSASTRNAIYNTLSSRLPAHLARQYEVYLQGSYRNDTNIYGESDVDVVVQFNGAHISDFSKLPVDLAAFYSQGTVDASYGWREFRRDVIVALRAAFGVANVKEGTKCIKVAGNAANRRPSDVVVALQYRNYQPHMPSTSPFVEGIVFFSQPHWREIVNYPKQHYCNGVRKMNGTGDWFKPTVRVFKNMRNRMINDGYLSVDLAPSYFLQCLIFNAPNHLFTSRYSDTVPNIINWLINLDADSLATLICQNDQHWLFGETEEQWDVGKALRFMLQAVNYWNDWT